MLNLFFNNLTNRNTLHPLTRPRLVLPQCPPQLLSCWAPHTPLYPLLSMLYRSLVFSAPPSQMFYRQVREDVSQLPVVRRSPFGDMTSRSTIDLHNRRIQPNPASRQDRFNCVRFSAVVHRGKTLHVPNYKLRVQKTKMMMIQWQQFNDDDANKQLWLLWW